MIIGIDARSLEGNKTGVGRYLENILRIWSEKKDLEFILYFNKEIPELDFLKVPNFKVRKIGNSNLKYSNFVFQHFLLPISFKKDNIDFFFSPFYLRPFFSFVKTAIVLHDISYEAHPEWFDSKSQFILRALSKISAKKADVIFTVSEYSKKEIIHFYGIKDEKIFVSHLAPDLEFIKRIKSANSIDVKNKYNIDKFIFYVGSIFTRRHVDDLIEAFSDFYEKNKNYKLVIAGKNHTYPFVDIDDMIKNVNSEKGKDIIMRLNFLSEEELISMYKESSTVVYLSDYEGFGLPVVEAQFFEKPVITSYNTSLIEVGGGSVEFVKENDKESVLLALDRVLNDSSRYEELVSRSKKNLGRFSWQRSAESILDIIVKKSK